MQLSTLRQMLKDTLGSPLPSVVRNATAATENANLLRYLNLAMGEMSSDIGGVESEATVALVASTRTYTRPTGLLQELDVRYAHATADVRVLERVHDHRELEDDYRSTTGQPTIYYWEGASLAVYPIPGTAEATKLLRVYGWYLPTDLAQDTDTPGYPPALHRCIALLAGALVLEAQARAEAQSANPEISADSVVGIDRTKEYAFRARDLRAKYEDERTRVMGPVLA